MLLIVLIYFQDFFSILILILFLMLCRNTQPRFQFIVMNRRNTGLDLVLHFYNSNVFQCLFDKKVLLCLL